jgi:hypothetical protein
VVYGGLAALAVVAVAVRVVLAGRRRRREDAELPDAAFPSLSPADDRNVPTG